MKPSATILLLTLACSVSAQELHLFEATETEPLQGPRVIERAGNVGVVASGQPAFTLKGLGRFGNDYHVTLLGRNGDSARVSWREGQRAAVPGYPDFALIGVAAGAVMLAYPPAETCMTLPTSGISCQPGNVALMRVATAPPLASNGSEGQNRGRGGNANAASVNLQPGAEPGTVVMGPDASGPGFFINPFNGEAQPVQNLSPEQRGVAERQQQRAARLRDVEPVRINEADVPPGMQVVRTPFGDRLVPIRE